MMVVDHLKLYLEIKLNYNYIGVKVHSWSGLKPFSTPQQLNSSSPVTNGNQQRSTASKSQDNDKLSLASSKESNLPSAYSATTTSPTVTPNSTTLSSTSIASTTLTTPNSTNASNTSVTSSDKKLFLLPSTEIELEFHLNKNNQCLRKWIEASKEFPEGVVPEVWIVEYDHVGHMLSKRRLVNPVIKNYQESVIPTRNYLLKCNVTLSYSGFVSVDR
jgi:hypothetical protein